MTMLPPRRVDASSTVIEAERPISRAREAAAAAAEVRLGEAGVRALRTKTLPREEYWRMMVEGSAS